MSISTGVRKAFQASQGNDFKEAFRLLKTHGTGMRVVAPSSLSLGNGTSSDTLSDIVTMLDGNEYNLSEATGAPGQQLTLTFTGVSEIYGLLLRAYYSGSGTHYCEVQLFNYTTSVWDVYLTVENSNGYNVRYIRIPDDSDYISSGEAQVRWEHPVAGNASHDAFIDFIGLEG